MAPARWCVVCSFALLSCSRSEPRPPATFSLSGAIGGAVAANVTVQLTGGSTASTTTDAAGQFKFTGLSNGSYVLTPQSVGYEFTPPSRAVAIDGADVTGLNFTATASQHPTGPADISGWIHGDMKQGVVVSRVSYSKGEETWTISDANGWYTFPAVPPGSYVLAAYASGYTFDPGNLAVTVTGVAIEHQDFTVSRAPSVGICAVDGWCWENPSPYGQSLNAVWGSSPNDVWAFGYAGGALHWDGSKWSQVPIDGTVVSAWGSSAVDVWAASSKGVVHWDGRTWTMSIRMDGTFKAVSGSSSSDVWAVGLYGVIGHWDGQRWSLVQNQNTLVSVRRYILEHR